MAILAVQRATAAGSAITLAAAAAGGDSFPNDGSTIFRVANSGGAPRTLTFDSPNACSFGVTDAAHDREVVVGAGEELEIGPFNQAQFNDGNSRVQVSYSDAAADLTVAAIAR